MTLDVRAQQAGHRPGQSRTKPPPESQQKNTDRVCSWSWSSCSFPTRVAVGPAISLGLTSCGVLLGCLELLFALSHAPF